MKRLDLIKAALFATSAGTWASLLVSSLAWGIHNMFSPHAGKLFVAAVCLSSLYCWLSVADAAWRRQALQERLTKAEQEWEQAYHANVPGSYVKARTLHVEVESLKKELSNHA
jgi:hypothetical protein